MAPKNIRTSIPLGSITRTVFSIAFAILDYGHTTTAAGSVRCIAHMKGERDEACCQWTCQLHATWAVYVSNAKRSCLTARNAARRAIRKGALATERSLCVTGEATWVRYGAVFRRPCYNGNQQQFAPLHKRCHQHGLHYELFRYPVMPRPSLRVPARPAQYAQAMRVCVMPQASSLVGDGLC